MANEVNSIIDNLCEKLGTTISDLTPEMAKMNIAENITIIVFIILLILVTIILGFKFIKHKNSPLYDSNDWISIMAGIVMCVLIMFSILGIILCLIIFIPDTIEWIVAPKARMAEYILNKI